MKCVPVHHGIPAVLHRDEPWLHRHSENGALKVSKEMIILRGDGNWFSPRNIREHIEQVYKFKLWD